MARHDLEITISNTGEVRAHVKGVTGNGCLKYAKLLEAIVGKIKEQQLTGEFYEPDLKARMEVKQRQKTGE